MTVVDLSQYDLPVDPACLKAAGVTGVILGVFHPSGPEPMAALGQACLDVGLPILGWYGLPYFGSPFGENRDITWAIANAQATGVKRVWIDCEIDAAPFGFTDDLGATPGGRVSTIRILTQRIRAAGLEPGIYSAPWWWRPNTGDTQEFRDLPLWFANYPADGHAMPELPDPFGGWTKPAIHQYTSSFNVCGRDRDANYVFEEDMSELEDIILACFSGGEEGNLPREQRLKNARDRMAKAALGDYNNGDRSLSQRIENIKAGKLPAHTHVPGGVSP